MTKRERLDKAYLVIDSISPERVVFLKEESDWRFLMLVMLSAQCSDAKVMATRDDLFRTFPTLEDFRDADEGKIADRIRHLGLYRSKARNLKAVARILLEKYDGKVPESFEDLQLLPGVGRKTANCVRAEVFSLPAVICDTHLIRLSNRLGFVDSQDPAVVESFYLRAMPPERRTRWSMAANLFARSVCKAQRPMCGSCPLSGLCVWKGRARKTAL